MTAMDIDWVTAYDLDWFGKCGQHIAHFATGGTDTMPDVFMKNKELWEKVSDFCDNLPTQEREIVICDENLPYFENDNEREWYLSSFVEMAKKGFYSHDIDFKNLQYKLIAYPIIDVKLPQAIYDLLPQVDLEKMAFPN